MKTHSTNLQLLLQQHGALRPEAWQQLSQLLQTQYLKTNQYFIRKEGTLAFVQQGLMVEYNPTDRLEPTVTNFLGEGSFLISRRHNKTYPLKACLASELHFIGAEQLYQLYLLYPELKNLYEGIVGTYDERTAFRQFILENPSAGARILLFKKRFAPIMPFLHKKDIANYLQLNYSHYLHVNRKLS